MGSGDGYETEDLATRGIGSLSTISVQGCVLEVLDGPAERVTIRSRRERFTIGSHGKNDLAVEDRTVSRFHCEVRLSPHGARLVDLGSRNGTRVDGVMVVEAFLRDESLIEIGQTTIRFRFAGDDQPVRLSARGSFGSMVGRSVAMRATFAELERAAGAEGTILLIGETGTGKEEAAHSVHDASRRAEGPFVVLDCSAIPGTLLESELFGHARGSFTGAAVDRVGAFETAHGGTIFMDEIGELPLDLQPRLLRILESRTVKRIGEHVERPIDVRVVAATNRDLRTEVNEGRFREDLYFRLAVFEIELPPLRERPEDIPVLAHHLLSRLATDEDPDDLLTDELVDAMQQGSWRGNVRQLRNYLEQYLLLREAPALGADAGRVAADPIDARMPYEHARRLALEHFERRYLAALLDIHGGNVAEAARQAGMNRSYLHRLLRRHNLRES